MNVKTTVELMVKSTRLSSYNKQIAIKCVWAVANVKEAEALKDLAEDVMALICDLVKHKVYQISSSSANCVYFYNLILLDIFVKFFILHFLFCSHFSAIPLNFTFLVVKHDLISCVCLLWTLYNYALKL